MNLQNTCGESCTVTGTGPITLAGALPGLRTVAAAYGTIYQADSAPIKIEEMNSQGEIVAWECCAAAVADDGIFNRGTISSSSAGGARVNFGSGIKRVFVTAPVEAFTELSTSIEDLQTQIDGIGSGGLAIGDAVTGAAANRILSTDASSNLAQSSGWSFQILGFGAGMASQQAFVSTAQYGGFIGTDSGGVLLGRKDQGVALWVGVYNHTGIAIPVNGKVGFGFTPNNYALCDAFIERVGADVIQGAALKMRAYTVATLPTDTATWIDTQVICIDETSGRVPVFCDGTNWRRVTDRAIAS